MIHFGTNTPAHDLIEMVNELIAYNASADKDTDSRSHRLELLPEQQAMYLWEDNGDFF